ncbi:SAM-dependent methyltransferase [Auritidibacter sp. NML120636]|nr:SAM-dependent methyltransferase [Auritidibacter sp. NML120636]
MDGYQLMTDHPQSRTHRVATGVDRLLLDQLDELLEQSPSYRDLPVVVVNETEGTVAAELRSRGMPLRVVQDSALLFDRLRAQADLAHEPWDDAVSREILQGAGTVLYRLPRPLEAVEETAWHVARWAKETVVLLAGARQKDLQRSVNDRLGQYFGHVSASRGAYKARVIRARDPHLPDATRQTPPRIPRVNTDRVLDHELALRAYGLTFGAARVDPGTRLMLETILGTNHAFQDAIRGAGTAVDLGSGNGTVATVLGLETSIPQIIATDDSAAAVCATRATLVANGLDNNSRFAVYHQPDTKQLADASVDLVVLNPPFHHGSSAVTRQIALDLFVAAGRVLTANGLLVAVWNSGLQYRPQLERLVGPTTQLARTKSFTVTISEVTG